MWNSRDRRISRASERALSRQDVRDRFVVNGLFDLPFGEEEEKGAGSQRDILIGKILGHVEIAPIVTLPLVGTNSGPVSALLMARACRTHTAPAGTSPPRKFCWPSTVAGGDVIGLDWRVELDEAWQRLGSGVGVQGNFDPVLLFSNRETIRAEVRRILQRAAGRPELLGSQLDVAEPRRSRPGQRRDQRLRLQRHRGLGPARAGHAARLRGPEQPALLQPAGGRVREQARRARGLGARRPRELHLVGTAARLPAQHPARRPVRRADSAASRAPSPPSVALSASVSASRSKTSSSTSSNERPRVRRCRRRTPPSASVAVAR